MHASPLAARRALVAELAKDGLDALDLHAIAAGPLMDANRLYLPAGRISLAEAERRERAGVEIVGGA